MSEFKENLEKVEYLLKIAQIHEEYIDCNNLYDFLGIDRTATKEEIKASIEEKYEFYLPKQSLSEWEILTKVFISSRPAIEYLLCEYQSEYNNHLIDLKVKELLKHLTSRTSTDRELCPKEKKKIIKECAEIGLSETQIIKIIDRWMEDDSEKSVEPLSSSGSSSDYVPPNELLNKTYYEIFGLSNDADYLEIKKAYDKEFKKYINTKDKARWSRISEAWETLKDSDKRETYDKEIKKPEDEYAVPALKVICKKDGYYSYKNVKKGTPFIETIVIKNIHKGQLKGKILSDAEWLIPERDNILYKQEQTLDIHIITSNIPENNYDSKGTITINTNGGPPYLIPFRVILEDLEIAAGRFRKTYVPLAAACAGFISLFSGLSFSGSPFPDFLVVTAFTGLIFFSIARSIIKATLQKGLNIFKPSSILIQGAAASIAISAILSYSSVSSIIKQKIGQEKLDITLRSEKPHIPVTPQPKHLLTLPEAENKQIIVNQVDHNQHSSLIADILNKGTISLSGSLTNVDSKTADAGALWGFGFEAMNGETYYGFGCNKQDELHFLVGGNDVDWTAGTEAMRSHPNRVTLYFRSKNWDFVQRCAKGTRCDDKSICPLAIVIEPNMNAPNTLHQPPLAEASPPPRIEVKSGKILKKDITRIDSKVPKKQLKSKARSFAPPSRDDL